jgi:dCTP diphosphatase
VVSKETIESLRQFVTERDWGQFHTAENLAKSIAIEAGELLECFQWGSNANPEEVADEIADILTYCILLGDRYGFDLDATVA